MFGNLKSKLGGCTFHAIGIAALTVCGMLFLGSLSKVWTYREGAQRTSLNRVGLSKTAVSYGLESGCISVEVFNSTSPPTDAIHQLSTAEISSINHGTLKNDLSGREFECYRFTLHAQKFKITCIKDAKEELDPKSVGVNFDLKYSPGWYVYEVCRP